jgi:DNA-binding IclR family transcriptional regulator
MSILEAVIASESAGLRLGDLADILGAPKSSIHGLAKGLVATGYLQEKGARYVQGPAVSSLLAIGGQQFHQGYRTVLEELSKSGEETALLSVLVGESVINVEIVEPAQLIRASPPLRQRRPLWPISSGKVFLAHMPERRRDTYLRRKFEEPAERERVQAELETIHETGVAFNRGESSPDLYGVASAIVVTGTEVTTAIGLAGPANRMEAKLDDIARLVRDAARTLSN